MTPTPAMHLRLRRHLVTFLPADRRKAIRVNLCFSACSLTLGETVEAGRHWGLLPPLVSSSTTGLSKPASSVSSSKEGRSLSQNSSLSKGVCSPYADDFKDGKRLAHPSEHEWYHCSRLVLENPFSSDVQPSSFCAATNESRSPKGVPFSPSHPSMRSASTVTSDCDRVTSTLEDVCRKQAYLSSVSRMPSHSRVGMVASHINLIHIEGIVRATFLGHRGSDGKDEVKHRTMLEALRNAWDKMDSGEEADYSIEHKALEEGGESREGIEEEDRDSVQVDHLALSRRSLWETEHLLPCFSPCVSTSPSTTAAPSLSSLSPLSTSTSFDSSSLPPLQLLIWLSVADSFGEYGISEPLVICCPLSPSLIEDLEDEVIEEGNLAINTNDSSVSSSPPYRSPLHHYFSSQLLRKRVIVSGQLREQERYDGDVHRIVPIPYVLLPLDGFGRNIRVLESIFSKKV